MALGTTAPLMSRTRTRMAPELPLKTGRRERKDEVSVPEADSTERGAEKRETSKSSGELGLPSGPLLTRRMVLDLRVTGVLEVVWVWP